MPPPDPPAIEPGPTQFTGSDVVVILTENHWLNSQPSAEQLIWSDHAASLLGHFAADRVTLTEILRLFFEFDAAKILQLPECHAVLARYAARDVIRHLAMHLLESGQLNSDRFKALIILLKDELHVSSRELFHPLRLALTGRSGGGALDRVVLLLDEAAALQFAIPVKSARTRILEFCAAMD